MASSGGIEMLFACTHCHKRFKLEELSSTQQLCKACRKKFPLVPCTFCRLEFHQTSNLKSDPVACEQCARELKQYGQPSKCSVCNLQSAFKGRKCTRCVHSEKKYGPPVVCDDCKLKRAFKKPAEARKKVDGKTLCLLCTLNFKKAQFKRKSKQESASGPQSKKPRMEEASAGSSAPQFPSAFGLPYASGLGGKEPDPVDPLSSELLLENDRLKDQLSSMKKQLAQKEQALLDKDKQICGLKAENFEREKDFRQKLLAASKSHNETVESLKMEVQNLKKQLSSKPRTKQSLTPTVSSLLKTS